jgi:hypothetical protein
MTDNDAHVRLYRARHPGDRRTIMIAYRRYILTRRKAFNGGKRAARALVHYRELIDTYLWAKRQVIHGR